MLGIFPMADSRRDKKIVFVDPKYRALMPIGKFKASKMLLYNDSIRKALLEADIEGISSGKIKYIGTNETRLNKLTDSTDEGRRKVDYLKFIPKQD